MQGSTLSHRPGPLKILKNCSSDRLYYHDTCPTGQVNNQEDNNKYNSADRCHFMQDRWLFNLTCPTGQVTLKVKIEPWFACSQWTSAWKKHCAMVYYDSMIKIKLFSTKIHWFNDKTTWVMWHCDWKFVWCKQVSQCGLVRTRFCGVFFVLFGF